MRKFYKETSQQFFANLVKDCKTGAGIREQIGLALLSYPDFI